MTGLVVAVWFMATPPSHVLCPHTACRGNRLVSLCPVGREDVVSGSGHGPLGSWPLGLFHKRHKGLLSGPEAGVLQLLGATVTRAQLLADTGQVCLRNLVKWGRFSLGQA